MTNTILLFSKRKGTYAIPKAQAEREMNENLASGKGGPPQIKESSGKKSSPKHDVVEDMDDDEESMDWWTKYFASVDAMIEVKFSRLSCLHLHFQLQHYYVSKQSYRKFFQLSE